MVESEGSSPTASVRIETAPEAAMPDGRLVVPIERAGQLVLVVREGQMPEALRQEFNSHFEHITHNRLWEQRWQPNEEKPPGHPH